MRCTIIGAITAADAMSYCMAQPGAVQADCSAVVDSKIVNGAYCDGEVVLYLGPSGEHLKRCVPDNVLQQKIAQMMAAQGTKFDPTPASASGSPVSGAWKVAAAIGVGLVVVLGLRAALR